MTWDLCLYVSEEFRSFLFFPGVLSALLHDKLYRSTFSVSHGDNILKLLAVAVKISFSSFFFYSLDCVLLSLQLSTPLSANLFNLLDSRTRVLRIYELLQ